jgi:hypothetical protein
VISSDDLRRLHIVAMNYFAEATELYKTRPTVGSPEWNRWWELQAKAIEANDAYFKAAGWAAPARFQPDQLRIRDA